MPKVCFYFQLHQPYRLGSYSIFDIGNATSYFKEHQKDENKQIFKKVSNKSYVPMLQLLLKLVKKHPEFRFALSLSGIFIEQAQEYEPEVIQLIKKLSKFKQVEFLAETYYHSLSSLYSKKEFRYQVQKHSRLIHSLTGQFPKVFRNTELIYSDAIGELVAELGFKGMLTEAVPRYLHGQPKTKLYSSYSKKRIPLLLKHADLSDDIAFRFSDRKWKSHPLSSQTYVHWLNSYSEDEIINLFMDFETFGEHQWIDTGIFDFFAHMVKIFLENPYNKFITPSQAVNEVEVQNLDFYKVPHPISWADIDRDLSAWLGNDLQDDTIQHIYKLESQVLDSNNPQLIEDWRRLQTSDHFYYMCIKWSNDGDVHAYFSPYSSPLDAYNRFTTVLADLKGRLWSSTNLVTKN